MLIDHEKVVLGLKARIREGSRSGKRSWGERELLEVLADLEVEYRLPESEQGFDDRPPVPVSERQGPGSRPDVSDEEAASHDAVPTLSR